MFAHRQEKHTINAHKLVQINRLRQIDKSDYSDSQRAFQEDLQLDYKSL